MVDLSPDALGAQVSMVLADFGADVIWVERPGGGRLRRQRSFPFLARGKHSVIADLKEPVGRNQVIDLAAQADVLIETFRPGVADRLGLGYAPLREMNPALVYTSITGFGRRGPWASLKGYEGVVSALLGIFGSFEGMNPSGPPPFVSVPWCSFAASQAALHGILAALFERESSGLGQWVEANMAQAVTIHEGASSAWYSYLVSSRWPDAFTLAPMVSKDGVPLSHFIFRLLVGQTRDGRWLQFAQNRPRLFEAFMVALGLEWMLTDPKWKGIPLLEDEDLRVELWDRMLTAVRERSLPEWESVFAANHDVYAECYRSGAEVLDHPQLAAENLIIEIQDPERGVVRQPGPMFRLSTTPAVPGRPAPVLGGHTAAGWASRTGPTVGPGPEGALPLAGITVLELAMQYAAPMGVTLLADLGARVIKVEPLDGEAIRRQVPQFPEAGGAKVMQGKESIALDLKTPEAAEIIHRLVDRVDAVVEGFRQGAAERISVDEATLRAINPELIYLTARGYGTGEPCGDRPAFAPTFGAAGGIATAQLGGPGPEDPSIGISEVSTRSALLRSASASKYASADGIASLGVATGLLMGLLARRRGAGGQHVACSMLQSTVHAMAESVIEFRDSPGATDPGFEMRGPHALYRVYDASDGWVFLAAPQREEWDVLAAAMEEYADLRGDERFRTPEGRADHDGALGELLAGAFRRRTATEWQAVLAAHDIAGVAVTTGPVEALLMSDEIGRASGYITDVDHPIFDRHPRLAPIVAFSRSTTQAGAGGLCGDSTESVLGEIGYPPDRIAELRAQRVIL